ncbi:MAG: hypothetical protein V1719_00805 [Patescibacteria group bacterium]
MNINLTNIISNHLSLTRVIFVSNGMNKIPILLFGIVAIISLTGCGTAKSPTSINGISNTTSVDDLVMIKQALVEKTSWPADQTTVSVLQNTGDHARGGVTFSDANGAEGGYWFAVKTEEGTWRIVLDGNGTISCDKMRDEGFPEAMIPDCA